MKPSNPLKPMRLAIDARYLAAEPSGIGRYSHELLRAMARVGSPHEHVVFVHDSWRGGAEFPSNFAFRRTPWRPLSTGTLTAMGRAIDREGCDLVHFHCPVTPRRFRTPSAVTFHDWQPLSDPDFSGGRPAPVRAAYDAFYRFQYRFAARRARALLCDSRATLEETARWAPADAARARIVTLGIEGFFFEEASPEERARARVLAGDGPFVLYVGSTRPNKRVPTLLAAFRRVLAAWPERSSRPRLVLVLSGDRFTEATLAPARAPELAGAVRVVLEATDDATLRALYREASVVAMATAHEGFGFPALEALAAGTPLVASSHGSLPELAGDAAAAMVEPGDETRLAEALLATLLDPATRRRASEAGPRRARGFDWDRCARETLAALETARSSPTGATGSRG